MFFMPFKKKNPTVLLLYLQQICIGKSRDDRKWYRVRIKHVMQSSHGGVATCFLLDHAEVCQINVLSLREPDPRFLELPYQVSKTLWYCVRIIKFY